MRNPAQIKTAIHAVCKQIEQIGEDAFAHKTPIVEAKRRMDKLDVELTALQAELAEAKSGAPSDLAAYHADVRRRIGFDPMLLGGTEFDGSGNGPTGRKAYGADVAPLAVSEFALKSMFSALKNGGNISLKANTDTSDLGGTAGILPTRLGTLATVHEPNRVLNYLPAVTTQSPIVEVVQVTGAELPSPNVNGLGFVVAAGGLKPMTHLTSQVITATVTKIAAAMSMNDESLADFPTFVNIVNAELTNILIDQENAQLLNGSGASGSIKGLNTFAAGDGIIVRPKSTDSRLDAVEQAIQDLRVGGSYAEAEVIVMHPTAWSLARREKDSTGKYLLNADPTKADALTLWGVPVVVTTAQPVANVLVLAPSVGIEAFIRESLNIRAGFVNDDFQRNKQTLVAEERITMAVTRPSGVVKITGF